MICKSKSFAMKNMAKAKTFPFISLRVLDLSNNSLSMEALEILEEMPNLGMERGVRSLWVVREVLFFYSHFITSTIILLICSRA